ncbi:MAG: hypothetical protein ACKO6Q_07925 [Bacteroidota bacterium]
MRKALLCLALWVCAMAQAQEIDYKKGKILVDGQEYLTLEVIKMNFGLTKNFEVFTPGGVKVATAEVNATKYESDKNDNSFLYYDVVFLPSQQKAVFKIASMGQEKSFAQLMGSSGILVNNKPDDAKIQAFITRRGVTPKLYVDYTPVSRSRSWPIEIKADRQITQESKPIGYFTASYADENGRDSYQIYLPTGVRVADLSFIGGNNAQDFDLYTYKDKYKRLVGIPQKDRILAADQSVDKNYQTLKRVVKWLVDNQIL